MTVNAMVTITRTISITDPKTGKKTTHTQEAHLYRNVTVDVVTGDVTYGEWTTGSWAQFDVHKCLATRQVKR